MKEKISELKRKASFIMNDKEYTKFSRHLKKKSWTDARLFIDNMLEECEISNMFEQQENIANTVKELKLIDNIITDTIIEQAEKIDDGGKQRRRIIRKPIGKGESTRFKALSQ